jgi:hypothetical protein
MVLKNEEKQKSHFLLFILKKSMEDFFNNLLGSQMERFFRVYCFVDQRQVVPRDREIR